MSHEFLSALDAAFLSIEDECNHMHVALTGVFEKAPLATADGRLDWELLRQSIETRRARGLEIGKRLTLPQQGTSQAVAGGKGNHRPVQQV